MLASIQVIRSSGLTDNSTAAETEEIKFYVKVKSHTKAILIYTK